MERNRDPAADQAKLTPSAVQSFTKQVQRLVFEFSKRFSMYEPFLR